MEEKSSSPYVIVEGVAHTVERSEEFDVSSNIKERKRLKELEDQIDFVNQQIADLKNLYRESTETASNSVLIFPSQWAIELGFVNAINVSPSAVTKEILMIHRTLPLDTSFISNVWRWNIKNKFTGYVTTIILNSLSNIYGEVYQKALFGFVTIFNQYRPKGTEPLSLENLPNTWKDDSLPGNWEKIKRRYVPEEAWETDEKVNELEKIMGTLQMMRNKLALLSGKDIPKKTEKPLSEIIEAIGNAWESGLMQHVMNFFEKDVHYSNFPLTSIITDAVYERYLMFVVNKRMTRDDLFMIEGQDPPVGVRSINASMTLFVRPTYWEESAKKMKSFYSFFAHDGSRDILSRILFRDESIRMNVNETDTMGRPVGKLYYDEMLWLMKHAPNGDVELKHQLILLFHMWAIGEDGILVGNENDLANEIAEQAKRLAVIFTNRIYVPEERVYKWLTSDSYLNGFFFRVKLLPYLKTLARNEEIGLNEDMTEKEMITIFYKRVFDVILRTLGIIRTSEPNKYPFLTEVAAKRGIFEGEEKITTKGLYTIESSQVGKDNKFASLPSHEWVRNRIVEYMTVLMKGKFLKPFYEKVETKNTIMRKMEMYELYFGRWRNYYEQFYELFQQNRIDIEKRFEQRFVLKDDPIRLEASIRKAYSDLHVLSIQRDLIEQNRKYVPVNLRINRPPSGFSADLDRSSMYNIRKRSSGMPINTEIGVYDIAMKTPLELTNGRKFEMRVDINLKPDYYAQYMKSDGLIFQRMEVIWIRERREVRKDGEIVFDELSEEMEKTVEMSAPVTVILSMDIYSPREFTGKYKAVVKSYFMKRSTGETVEFENRSNWLATIDERFYCVRCNKFFNRYLNPFGSCKWKESVTLEYMKALKAYREAETKGMNGLILKRLEMQIEEEKARMDYKTQRVWIDKHSDVNEFHEKADRENGIHGSYLSKEWGYDFKQMDKLLTEAYSEFKEKLELKKELIAESDTKEEVRQLEKDFTEWKMKYSKFHKYQQLYNDMQEAPKNPFRSMVSPKKILTNYQSLGAALNGIQ